MIISANALLKWVEAFPLPENFIQNCSLDFIGHSDDPEIVIKIHLRYGNWSQAWIFKPDRLKETFPRCVEHFKNQMKIKTNWTDTVSTPTHSQEPPPDLY